MQYDMRCLLSLGAWVGCAARDDDSQVSATSGTLSSADGGPPSLDMLYMVGEDAPADGAVALALTLLLLLGVGLLRCGCCYWRTTRHSGALSQQGSRLFEYLRRDPPGSTSKSATAAAESATLIDGRDEGSSPLSSPLASPRGGGGGGAAWSVMMDGMLGSVRGEGGAKEMVTCPLPTQPPLDHSRWVAILEVVPGMGVAGTSIVDVGKRGVATAEELRRAVARVWLDTTGQWRTPAHWASAAACASPRTSARASSGEPEVPLVRGMVITFVDSETSSPIRMHTDADFFRLLESTADGKPGNVQLRISRDKALGAFAACDFA